MQSLPRQLGNGRASSCRRRWPLSLLPSSFRRPPLPCLHLILTSANIELLLLGVVSDVAMQVGKQHFEERLYPHLRWTLLCNGPLHLAANPPARRPRTELRPPSGAFWWPGLLHWQSCCASPAMPIVVMHSKGSLWRLAFCEKNADGLPLTCASWWGQQRWCRRCSCSRSWQAAPAWPIQARPETG